MNLINTNYFVQIMAELFTTDSELKVKMLRKEESSLSNNDSEGDEDYVEESENMTINQIQVRIQTTKK